MRLKDSTVETNFHHMLTRLLFAIDSYYLEHWNTDLLLTSGSEQLPEVEHSYTSLHYATPGQAADARSWLIPNPNLSKVPITAAIQHRTMVEIAIAYCESIGIPTDWYDIVLESNHIHIEYQPKRITG